MSGKNAKKQSKAESKAKKEVESEPEVVDDVEAEAEEPESKKMPTKTKVGAKSKKGSKKGNAETAAKKKEELARYDAALKTVAEIGLVTVHPDLTSSTTQEKWANAVNLHVLEVINNIQHSEVTKADDYNPFPADKFVLYEDKLNGGGKKKASVKTDKASSVKKKKTLILRGKKVADEPVEAEAEQTEEPEAESPATEEKKAPSKRIIASFTKDGKNYLTFFVMRFVGDLMETEGGKAVKSREDFARFVYTQVTKDINSHVSRSVVTTVDRMFQIVNDYSGRGVSDELVKQVGSQFGDRSMIGKYLGDYLSDYLKLLGFVIAQNLWVSCKKINKQVVESAIRILDMGNHEKLVELKVADEATSDFGLSHGFFQDAHQYHNLTIPKPKPKAKTAKPKTKKGKKKAVEEEPVEAEADGEDAEHDEEEPAEDAEHDEAADEAAEDEVVDEEEPAEDAEEPAEEEEAAPKKKGSRK